MGIEVLLGGGAALLAIMGTLFTLLLKSKKKEGVTEARAEAQQQVDQIAVGQAATEVKQVEQANEIRDDLRSDPTDAQRVRDRFTRD